MTVRFVIYVGNFEGNAFAYLLQGTPVVNVPVEESDAWRCLIMPHGSTHVVHGRLSHANWLRFIAYSMMQEALAIHASMRIDSSNEALSRFIFGTGSTGLERAMPERFGDTTFGIG